MKTWKYYIQVNGDGVSIFGNPEFEVSDEMYEKIQKAVAEGKPLESCGFCKELKDLALDSFNLADRVGLTEEEPFEEDFDDEEEFDELSDMIDEGFGTRFFKLPDETDINKYNIMQEFIEILPDEEMRLYLDDEIHQRGAHRRFRDGIRHYGIEDDWYDFLHESHIRIAREWCDRNGFSYTEQEGNE